MIDYPMLLVQLVQHLSEKIIRWEGESFGEFFRSNLPAAQELIAKLQWNGKALLANDPELRVDGCQLTTQGTLASAWMSLNGWPRQEMLGLSGVDFASRDDQIGFYACANLLTRVWKPELATYEQVWQEVGEANQGSMPEQ